MDSTTAMTIKLDHIQHPGWLGYRPHGSQENFQQVQPGTAEKIVGNLGEIYEIQYVLKHKRTGFFVEITGKPEDGFGIAVTNIGYEVKGCSAAEWGKYASS